MNQPKLLHLRRLATFMDSQFEGPGGLKFGFDGLIGLIPIVGDFATTMVSIYILLQAAVFGCSPSVILRMGLNIVLDTLLSAIPMVGNVFDFFWKSNNRNLDLLESHLMDPRATTNQSRLVVALVLLAMLSALAAAGWLTIYVISAIVHWAHTP